MQHQEQEASHVKPQHVWGFGGAVSVEPMKSGLRPIISMFLQNQLYKGPTSSHSTREFSRGIKLYKIIYYREIQNSIKTNNII